LIKQQPGYPAWRRLLFGVFIDLPSGREAFYGSLYFLYAHIIGTSSRNAVGRNDV